MVGWRSCGATARLPSPSVSSSTPLSRACAHKWIDLSERDYGVAVLNDCKALTPGKLPLVAVRSRIEGLFDNLACLFECPYQAILPAR